MDFLHPDSIIKLNATRWVRFLPNNSSIEVTDDAGVNWWHVGRLTLVAEIPDVLVANGIAGPLAFDDGDLAAISPTAYWTMDEGADEDRGDSVGSNHLLETGTVAVIAGKHNNALDCAVEPWPGTNYLATTNNFTPAGDFSL